MAYANGLSDNSIWNTRMTIRKQSRSTAKKDDIFVQRYKQLIETHDKNH